MKTVIKNLENRGYVVWSISRELGFLTRRYIVCVQNVHRRELITWSTTDGIDTSDGHYFLYDSSNINDKFIIAMQDVLIRSL